MFTIAVFSCIATVAFSQARKPRIMVFPSDTWMNGKNYFYEIDNQGTKTKVYDYQKALANDKELYSVINKIDGMMIERGFPLEDLAPTLKSLADQTALDNMDQNREGGSIAESPRDKLLKVAKPDIVLEIDWEVLATGPKKSIKFDLKGIDAGTNKAIATAGGVGQPSFSAEIPALLNEAVLAHIDNFNTQLMAHFDDMFANGREISLNIKVWDTSPKKLNDEINDDGDELKDDIKKWMTENTVKGRFSLVNTSPNMMIFKQVRISLYDASGNASDADTFASGLRKYLRKTYQLPCESGAIGLGLGEVIIGGKR